VKNKKVLLLGCGIQGKGALYDLLRHDAFDEITVADSRIDLRLPFPSPSTRARVLLLGNRCR
jgi:Saccharopine dehydrogenase and related proteins